MKPTVGRIVHFYTDNQSQQSNGRKQGPYAAIIVGVCGAGDGPNQMVNLKVFADHGADLMLGSVRGNNTVERTSEPRYWEWPPMMGAVTMHASAVAAISETNVQLHRTAETTVRAQPEDAPTGIEGRVGKIFALDLEDAKALRRYIDLATLPYDDQVAPAVKNLHWLITDAERPETFFDRLLTERRQLKARLDALGALLHAEQPVMISNKQWLLLGRQHRAMTEYYEILVERIEDMSVAPEAQNNAE